MDVLMIVAVGVVLYAVGIGLFIRFAVFIHRCDDEMKSMLKDEAMSSHTMRLHSRRPSRPKPRLRAAWLVVIPRAAFSGKTSPEAVSPTP